jgi:hypothetical protein
MQELMCCENMLTANKNGCRENCENKTIENILTLEFSLELNTTFLPGGEIQYYFPEMALANFLPMSRCNLHHR